MPEPSLRLLLAGVLLALQLRTGARGQISPLPGQVPLWPPTYDMNASSFVMLCANNGTIPLEHFAGFGIVDVDWSSAKVQWAAAKPMNAEELLLAQAALIKQGSPNTRVFVYRNSVKALPWFTSVRTKLEDPRYAAWFLPFKCNGTKFHAAAGCSFVDDQDYDQGASGPLPVVSAA